MQIGRKAPPPPLFYLLVRYSTHIVAHDVTSRTNISCIIEPHFGFCGRKAPPRMMENFLTSDLSILGNFEQLWFLWQKSPPHRMMENFLTSDLSISGNFEELWFLWQKSPPPTHRMMENFLTSDLSILGNFEQLWFLWQKSPPPPR